jgi:hypothetical protein
MNREIKCYNTMFNTTSITIDKNLAIADAGATSHIILPDAPTQDVKPTIAPLKINLPNRTTLKSTHTAMLNIPCLPPQARQAHIVPGLSNASLISIKHSAMPDVLSHITPTPAT